MRGAVEPEILRETSGSSDRSYRLFGGPADGTSLGLSTCSSGGAPPPSPIGSTPTDVISFFMMMAAIQSVVKIGALPSLYFQATRGVVVDRETCVVLAFLSEGGLDQPPAAMEVLLPPSGLSTFVYQVRDLLKACEELEKNRPRPPPVRRPLPTSWERQGVPWGAQLCYVTRVTDLAAVHFYLVAPLPPGQPPPAQVDATPVLSCGLDVWALEEMLKQAEAVLPSKNAASPLIAPSA